VLKGQILYISSRSTIFKLAGRLKTHFRHHETSDPDFLVSAIMNATSAAPRRHHTDLQPLTTRPDTPVDPSRRKSTQSQGSPPPKSSAAMPSPSIIAARAYYLEMTSPIRPEDNADKRRRSLFQGQQVPRRHSVVPTTSNLVSQLENFSFGSAAQDLQPVPEGDETEPKIKTKDEDVCMSGVTKSTFDVGEIQHGSTSAVLFGTPQDILRQVPFEYTHDHLRDWGYAYLGNAGTADAFVSAVSLRRPSLALVKEDGFQVKSTVLDLVTIRARVLPRGNERKPFLIQRQFNISELRSSILKARMPRVEEEGYIPNRPRRSSRVRRSSAWQGSGEVQWKGNGKILIPKRHYTLGYGSVPIRESFHNHLPPTLLTIHRHRVRASLPSCSSSFNAVRPRQKRRRY